MTKHVKVAVLVADGFEETELIVCRDVLVRSNIIPILFRVATNNNSSDLDYLSATSALGLKVCCDHLFRFDHNWREYHALIIPGGTKGVVNLSSNHLVLKVVNQFYRQAKVIGAICAGPLVLRAANIIQQQHLTSYPGVATKFKDNPNYHGEVGTVVDANHRLITSQSLGTVFGFTLAVIEQLLGVQAKKKVHAELLIYDASSILYFQT